MRYLRGLGMNSRNFSYSSRKDFRFKFIVNWLIGFVLLCGAVSVYAAPRITTGQLALYTFEEGSGTTVTDLSGVGTPLNLTIETPTATTWVAGGLSVNSSAVVASASAADKVIAAIQKSNALTI